MSSGEFKILVKLIIWIVYFFVSVAALFSAIKIGSMAYLSVVMGTIGLVAIVLWFFLKWMMKLV